MAKKTREQFKTYKAVFDIHAERALFKLSSQGHFDHLESPISIGKEANLFTAVTKEGDYRIVKIYRVENCDFTKMYDYLKLDPRFPHPKKARRQTIFTWVRREYRNLLKAREADVRVPTPYAFFDNIIVMELIGTRETGEAAPKLKDLPPEDPAAFFEKLIDQMTRLFRAGLVHGDLSKFNILNWNDQPVLIDFSQGTTTGSTHAKELLTRDVQNVISFFSRLGIKEDGASILRRILHTTIQAKTDGKKREKRKRQKKEKRKDFT